MNSISNDAIVKIAQGTLRGRIVNKTNGTFYSFQGIPYAKPPLGPLRFKPPQPPGRWTEIRDAFYEGPSSAQIDVVMKTSFYGEEDCLYLNVYTPKLPKSNEEFKVPVMFFIHGGAYVGGSGNATNYGPAYLAPKVVLVTINYRLGALGFLSLPKASVPGNNGLKDQVAALRWVQQNIATFGGDPNNVTIFGESAGGASVNYHVLSPMSKGLFHRAIAQSGCVLNPWASCTPEEAKQRALKLGNILGCKSSDQHDLLKFLLNVNPKDIVEGSEKLATEEEKWAFTMAFFLPVPELKESPDEVFLSDSPLNLLRKGNFNQVPYMTGITSSEGICLIAALLENPELVKSVDETFVYQLPPEIRKKGKAPEIAKTVRKYYFGDKKYDKSCFQRHVDFFTHTWFLNGISQTLSLLLDKFSQPIYYYLFEFVGERNFYKKLVKADFLKGASHIDDLGYLFQQEEKEINPKSPSYNMMQKMVKLWTNFAKTGNPTSKLDSDINVKWPPLTAKNGKYYKINSDLSVMDNLMIDDINFWQKIAKS